MEWSPLELLELLEFVPPKKVHKDSTIVLGIYRWVVGGGMGGTVVKIKEHIN